MADETQPSGAALPAPVRSGFAAGFSTETEAPLRFRPGSLPDAAAEDGAAAIIDALRSRGAARFDAVAFYVIEAMWRRGEHLCGAARTALQHKLARRLATFRERFERAGGETGAGAGLQVPPRGRSPLAELLAHAARSGANAAAPAQAASPVGPGTPAVELKSLRYFGSTWSRLSLEQQLSQALAQAPDNAGPLNSHFLVLQALIRMRDIAPQYLENFMSYADALLWLDLLDPGKGAGSKSGSQKTAARKPATRKTGQRKTRG
ncbi:DUF2894 domain-containing protein [Thauera butanivorans]|uniref:DUF2894 domain-containing protein n=1 Tax=Thauera butanivorans TaxID=86174 RepID=UPI0009FFC635|nr:DUF2894 domain-containing protein [Thauera butanivorans]